MECPNSQDIFFGIAFGPLLKIEEPLKKNQLKLLAKNLLIPIGLTAAALATDAGIL